VAKAGVKDQYSNVGYGTVTEGGANTLTFAEIQTNVSVFEKIAWVIQRIEWYIPLATRSLLLDASDQFEMALCSSNTLTSLSLGNPAVIDLYALLGSAVTAHIASPIIRDFSMLPGGGRIIAPRPLHLGLKGTSVASAGTISCRFLFTMKELSADEYIELVDFYRIVQ